MLAPDPAALDPASESAIAALVSSSNVSLVALGALALVFGRTGVSSSESESVIVSILRLGAISIELGARNCGPKGRRASLCELETPRGRHVTSRGNSSHQTACRWIFTTQFQNFYARLPRPGGAGAASLSPWSFASTSAPRS